VLRNWTRSSAHQSELPFLPVCCSHRRDWSHFDPSSPSRCSAKNTCATPNVEITGRADDKPPARRRRSCSSKTRRQFAIYQKILVQKGYRVLEASDGAIALRVAAVMSAKIDLVLTDVANAQPWRSRNGRRSLKELSPGMRVLFMSGYPKEEVFPDKETAKNTPYLQKPFTSERCFRSALRPRIPIGLCYAARADCAVGAPRRSCVHRHSAVRTVLSWELPPPLTKILERRRRPGDDQKVDHGGDKIAGSELSDPTLQVAFCIPRPDR